MDDYYELKKKQHRAIVAVCTLGFSESYDAIFTMWKERKVSTSQYELVRWMINGMFFIFWLMLISVIMWVTWLVKLIYYSIELHKLKKNTQSNEKE